MSEASSRISSASATLLALVTIPLLIAIAVAELFAGSAVAEDASPAVLEAVDTATSAYMICMLVAIAVSAVLLYLRSGSSQGAAPAIEGFLRSLGSGDFVAATEELRQRNLLVPTIEAELATLEASHKAAQESHEQPLRQLTTALRPPVAAMRQEATTQEQALDEANTASEQGLRYQQSVGSHVDSLSRSAEATSASILEMVAINNEVTENVHNLSMSVEETTTAIEEMTFSVKEVAKNIEELSTAAEETAASMNQMDVSISQVEGNANETSALSETVTANAEKGASAITQTIQGIDRIKDSSRMAASVLGTLGERIDEIGNILTVIDDVAEQTNLLALNAAIIAAQAGEHGRGFAVVADEIKALAERTGASTKEIAELIKTVQSESRNAINTMSKGIEDVENGVRLGHNAEDALRKIVESAQRSTLMIKAIAQATVEQAKGSKQVTNAIGRIAETVQQIALATSEQARGSEQIMKSAERMRVITQQVERSAEEQNRGGRQITEAMETIREVVEQINRLEDEQARSNERMAMATQALRLTGQRSGDACVRLEQLLESYRPQ